MEKQLSEIGKNWIFYRGIFLVLLAWFASLSGLMIVDVWDETNFFLLLRDGPLAGLSLVERIIYIWGNSISIYRPLATSLGLLLEALGSGFQGLRYFCALLLAVSATLLGWLQIRYFNVSQLRATIFVALFLFSSSAIIVATWFANIFDATCLFLLVLSFYLLLRERWVMAGIAAGCAFFCKETAVLFVVFVLISPPGKNSEWRGKAVAFSIYSVLGLIYFFIRQRLIQFGSDGDIHGFDFYSMMHSGKVFLDGYWFQNTKFAAGSVEALFGDLVLLLSVFFMGVFLSLVNFLVLAISVLIYSGMFSYQGDNVVDSLNFIGRLYLIPAVISLFLLTISRGGRGLLLVAFPLFLGGWQTYFDHLAFQQVYQQIYERAALSVNEYHVNYPLKPLKDSGRNLVIDDFPDAVNCIDVNLAQIAECRH